MDPYPYEILSPADRVRAYLRRLCDGVTATPDDLQALTPDLIQAIEADQPAPISDAYRAFLAMAGGGAGRFFQGSDVFYPDVIGIRAVAEEMLGAHGRRLENTDRVILMHHDAQFDFTRGRGPDPEVWSYSDGDEPTPTYPSFSDWLRANVEEQTKAYERLAVWYSTP